MIKKTTLGLIVFMLIRLSVYCQSDFQSGYIQTSEKDTIYGLINYREDKSNNQTCYFKKNEDAPIQKFLPEQLFGYRFNNNKYYISKQINTLDVAKTCFVEYLLKGTVNLYYYRDEFGDHYLIQKEELPIKEISLSDEMVFVEGTPYKRKYLINRGIIRYYLADCPELFDKIDQIKNPSHQQLISLIKKYHDIKCPNDVCIIYKKTLPKFRIDIQPIIGTTRIGAEFTKMHYGNSSYGLQYGMLTNIWLPYTSERIFFRSGLLYSKNKELDEVVGNYYLRRINKFDYYNIPLEFQYIFLKHRISPTFGAGLNLFVTHQSFSFIPAFNLGVNLKINQNIYLSCNSEISYFGKYFIIPDKTTKLGSNSFSIGLTFIIK